MDAGLDLIDSLDLLDGRPESQPSTEALLVQKNVLASLFSDCTVGTLGRFEVRKLFGRGANGSVFEGWDPQLQRAVAIKILHRQADAAGRERLLREAQGLAKVRHPGVLTIFETGQERERLFLVMELMRGGTLRGWLKQARSLQEIAAAFVSPAFGLAAAHDEGIVHRDIKPDNFVLDAGGNAKLADFGLATSESIPGENNPRGDGSAAPRRFAGTPAYAAPEQLEFGTTSPAADVYALCVTLHEAVYGARPRSAGTEPPAQTSSVVGQGEVPAALRQVLQHGMLVDPALRPTARGVATVLAALAGEQRARELLLATTSMASEALKGLLPHLHTEGQEEVVQASVAGLDPSKEPEELSLRLFSNLCDWIRDEHGQDQLARVLQLAGLEESNLKNVSSWASSRQIEVLMDEVRKLAGSDEVFETASVYKLAEGMGPLRYGFMAASMGMLVAAATKNYSNISRVSRVRYESGGRGRLTVWYTSDVPESRLMCLSRIAHSRMLPTLWGLPKAHVVERGCRHRGDEACIYELHYYEAGLVWLPIAGALTGLLAGLAAEAGGMGSTVTTATLTLVGGMLAHILQLTRGNRTNVGTGFEINELLGELLDKETEARKHLEERDAQQREWTRTLETQVLKRTTRLNTIVDRLRELDSSAGGPAGEAAEAFQAPLAMLKSETNALREHLALGEAREDQGSED